jgi:hypothetical protein
VGVDVSRPGAVIPADFLGLSFETPVVHSPAILSSAPALDRLLGLLGSGVLRISGDSVDRTQWLVSPATPAPWAISTVAPADLVNLAGLMSATGWKLLLGIDLAHHTDRSVVEEARAAASIFGGSLAGLEIGNEPDLYTRPSAQPFRSVLGVRPLRPHGWGLADYEAEVNGVRGALAHAGVSAPVYGPDTATGAWLNRFAARTPPGLGALTAHLYPLDRCRGERVSIPGPSVASLLSRGQAARESARIGSFIRAAALRRLALRLDETNSVACGGQPGTSDTFASALWALDLSLIAARQGVAGVNFHGGLGSCERSGTITSPWYSPLCALSSGQLRARPEYYALLLLRSLENCAFVRVAYRTSRDISVYALRAPDGSLRVIIDDMESSVAAPRRGRRPATVSVSLHVDRPYRQGSVVRLLAPSIHAKQGVTLGGASIGPDGGLPPPASEPLLGAARPRIQVKPGSAAVVTLAP